MAGRGVKRKQRRWPSAAARYQLLKSQQFERLYPVTRGIGARAVPLVIPKDGEQ